MKPRTIWAAVAAVLALAVTAAALIATRSSGEAGTPLYRQGYTFTEQWAFSGSGRALIEHPGLNAAGWCDYYMNEETTAAYVQPWMDGCYAAFKANGWSTSLHAPPAVPAQGG